jgi:hypothetical protein
MEPTGSIFYFRRYPESNSGLASRAMPRTKMIEGYPAKAGRTSFFTGKQCIPDHGTPLAEASQKLGKLPSTPGFSSHGLGSAGQCGT